MIDPSTSTLRGSASDLGVLSMKNDRTLADDEGRHLARKPKADTSCPEEDIVVCDLGNTVSVGGNTTHSAVGSPCAIACEGMCCSGLNSCDRFTGAVCKDGMSCSSNTDPNYSSACNGANIAMVHRGCNGAGSCGGAILLLVQDACNNNYACGGANSPPFYIPDPVCATQCCNNDSECVRNRLPDGNLLSTADMIDKCGKCNGKQLNMFT